MIVTLDQFHLLRGWRTLVFGTKATLPPINPVPLRIAPMFEGQRLRRVGPHYYNRRIAFGGCETAGGQRKLWEGRSTVSQLNDQGLYIGLGWRGCIWWYSGRSLRSTWFIFRYLYSISRQKWVSMPPPRHIYRALQCDRRAAKRRGYAISIDEWAFTAASRANHDRSQIGLQPNQLLIARPSP